ncbi:hypothetical protein BJ546DRAFT_455829 [Cryomyces antarcticus]
MAGASKKRQQRERRAGEGSESDSSSPSHSSHGPASESQSQHARMASSSQASPLRRSPPRYDGNRDPEAYIEGAGGVTSRDPNTSGVIIDARRLDLGMGGWSTVRGVSPSSSRCCIYRSYILTHTRCPSFAVLFLFAIFTPRTTPNCFRHYS